MTFYSDAEITQVPDMQVDDKVSISIALRDGPPIKFFRMELEGGLVFEKLPQASSLLATLPYDDKGPMSDEKFPGWDKLPALLGQSSFYSYAEPRPVGGAVTNAKRLRLAIKGVLHPTTKGDTLHAFLRMQRDVIFYAKHLRSVQGDVVPVHYGLWYAKDTVWGGDVAIALMEWGGMPWRWVYRTVLDIPERRLRISKAFDKLHDLGIVHWSFNSTHLHHVLYNEKTEAIRIVDFSTAFTGHICHRMLPTELFKSTPKYRAFDCHELWHVRNLIRLFGGVDPAIDHEVRRAFSLMQMAVERGMPRSQALEMVGKQIIDDRKAKRDFESARSQQSFNPSSDGRVPGVLITTA